MAYYITPTIHFRRELEKLIHDTYKIVESYSDGRIISITFDNDAGYPDVFTELLIGQEVCGGGKIAGLNGREFKITIEEQKN